MMRTPATEGRLRLAAVLLLFPLPGAEAEPVAPLPGGTLKLTHKQASSLAQLALKGIRKEFPNKPGDVLNSDADAKRPRTLHPAFYGCFDWHSAVHSHWMLVRLLRLFPDLPEAKQVRAALAEHLTAKNLKAEADSFARPNARSFERPYGWAWLLKLAEELHGWDDADAKKWSKDLKPLADTIVSRYLAFFPKQTYPIRTGVHPNTAFGLAFALDYARAVDHKQLRQLIEERSRSYFARDVEVPAAWEPGGADFFSPSLMEADLMRRVLPPAEFRTWFRRFLPGVARGEPKSLLKPATVTDRSDPQLVHLDGLNLSRAWCMRGVAAALPADDPARKVLAESAARQVGNRLSVLLDEHADNAVAGVAQAADDFPNVLDVHGPCRGQAIVDHPFQPFQFGDGGSRRSGSAGRLRPPLGPLGALAARTAQLALHVGHDVGHIERHGRAVLELPAFPNRVVVVQPEPGGLFREDVAEPIAYVRTLVGLSPHCIRPVSVFRCPRPGKTPIL